MEQMNCAFQVSGSVELSAVLMLVRADSSLRLIQQTQIVSQCFVSVSVETLADLIVHI